MWIRRAVTAPDEQCISQGAKFVSQIERGKPNRTGTVRDEQGNVHLRYKTRRIASPWRPENPLSKPDFVVTSPEHEVVIRRVSFLPSVFRVVERGETTGIIKTIGVLRNRYAISLNDTGEWEFYMPLFAVAFHGDSPAGTDIWVIVAPSEREWNVLLKTGTSPHPLLACLAFIHCERYYSS
jgi:hypothetical protein